MDQHLGPGAVVMPQAASLHVMVVEFRVGPPRGFLGRGWGIVFLCGPWMQVEHLGS